MACCGTIAIQSFPFVRVEHEVLENMTNTSYLITRTVVGVSLDLPLGGWCVDHARNYRRKDVCDRLNIPCSRRAKLDPE